MYITQILPGITLRCYPDSRFLQGCLSLQLLRPMDAREASMNALLPALLLRGCRSCPDLRAITLRLDDLYGASVSTLVRRVGDYQTTGLSCSFLSDSYTMDGDRVLAPMLQFLGELLLDPVTENGCFRSDYLESEKRNLISAMDALRNEKNAYSAERLRDILCRNDSMGIPRLGRREDVEAIRPDTLYAHYRKLLRESTMEIFYVGSEAPEKILALLKPIVQKIPRDFQPLPPQTPFHPAPDSQVTEPMEVAQSRLCMGFVTPITVTDPRFAAMQMCNAVLGGSMTNKLFTVLREQMSLCYEIGSYYSGSKGLVSIYTGIENANARVAGQEICNQLQACREGRITEDEMQGARELLLSQLQQVHDTPGSIEGYYESAVLSGLPLTPEAYMDAVRAVTVRDVVEAAGTLRRSTVYFLKGAEQ